MNVFRTTSDPKKVEVEASWRGFRLPLDFIVNDDAVWMTDLSPLRFIKLNFKGERLYTWLVPADLPDGSYQLRTVVFLDAGPSQPQKIRTITKVTVNEIVFFDYR